MSFVDWTDLAGSVASLAVASPATAITALMNLLEALLTFEGHGRISNLVQT
jgi:hypothetical protein